jgi:hypothetical protein
VPPFVGWVSIDEDCCFRVVFCAPVLEHTNVVAAVAEVISLFVADGVNVFFMVRAINAGQVDYCHIYP